MNQKALPADLLRRYLSGQCTEEEREVVEEWYRHLDHDAPSFYEFDTHALREKIRTRIGVEERPPAVKHVRLGRRGWLWVGGVAASVLVGLLYLYRPQTSPELRTAEAEDIAWMDYTNKKKKIERFLLPDSSVVWLHPEARISFPSSFVAHARREVRFSGEGFFDVARDTLHPFVIYSGDLRTQVLGTSFNVKAYANQPTSHVSVVSGSVAVSTPSDGVSKEGRLILKPNQQATFQHSTRSLTLLTLHEGGAQKESWQPVSLAFDDTPVAEVAVRLEKIFRVKISLTNDRLGLCRLRVDFNNQRLPEILDMINTLLGTTYEMEGEKIVLSGEGC